MEGTGFFVQKDDDIFLITNRHVAELPYAHPEYAGATLSEFLCKGYECMTAESLPEKYGTLKIANADKFVYHPNRLNDIACLKNPQCVMTSTTTSSISLPIPFSMLATEEQLNNKLCVCDRIAYPGFPEWYDKKNQTPIFRMGTIASDPRLGYSRQVGSPPVDRVAYEGFSSNGASGSPVFAIQKGFRLQVGETLIDDFYREGFVKAKEACGFDPMAKETVALVKEMGFQVALATNPIFPMIATRQRMEWAGLKREDFALCTTYENIGVSKPNPAYYTEIAKRLRVEPEECLMVGNDVSEDMVAAKIGMKVFLLTDCLLNKNNEDISEYPQGGFRELQEFIKLL